MARSDTVKILSPSELPPAMKASFERIYDLKREIEALKAEHITPIADEITALWRDLKASSNMTRRDLDIIFRVIERWWQAEEMEDEAEGARIQDNIRRAFSAARRGEMINFLDVLEDTGAAGREKDATSADDDFEDNGDGFVEDEHRDQQLRDEISDETDEKDEVSGPDADWGEDQAPVPAEQDDGSSAGHAYNLGEQAGFDGHTDVKGLIKAQGWNARSIMAKNFAAGHAKGFKRFQQVEEAKLKERLNADRFKISQAGHKVGYEDRDEPNPYDAGSESATIWSDGYAGGVIRRENEEKTGTAPIKIAFFDEDDGVDNVVEFGRPIPLPTVSTDVRTSSGDVA